MEVGVIFVVFSVSVVAGRAFVGVCTGEDVMMRSAVACFWVVVGEYD